MTRDIRQIEEFTLNAWPSLGQVLLDGWVLRFADGYTRRSNSVNPLHAGSMDVHEKIRECERIYRDAGLPPTFKLTVESRPQELKEILLRAGYQEAAGASVQVCDLQTAATLSADNLRFWAWPADEWLDAFITFNNVEPRHRKTVRAIISAIVPLHRVGAVIENDQIVACGLGVVQAPWLGLFDIVTRPDRRRQGIGRRMMGSLMDWGLRNGATAGVLQVMTGNAPAWALYEEIGFREAYEYQYFVK